MIKWIDLSGIKERFRLSPLMSVCVVFISIFLFLSTINSNTLSAILGDSPFINRLKILSQLYSICKTCLFRTSISLVLFRYIRISITNTIRYFYNNSHSLLWLLLAFLSLTNIPLLFDLCFWISSFLLAIDIILSRRWINYNPIIAS